MYFLQEKLFLLWLLLLPVSWVVAAYIPVIAPDKMIAPLLILLGIVSQLRAPAAIVIKSLIYGSLVILLLFVKHISFISSETIFWSLIWDDMVKLGYFMIPILCIRDVEGLRKAGWVIVLIAVSGCISAFLVSMGLMTLPVERFEASRLGIETLRKAIGLFPSYGDLAQYLAFAVLWVIVAPGGNERSGIRLRFMRYLVATSVILGLLGTQSRNILLSLLVALAVLWVLTRMERAGVRAKTGLVLGLSGIFIIFVGFLGIFAADVIDALSSLGGNYAKHTAMARLEQYSLAWRIISESPLFGADVLTYQKLGLFIEGIHNLWLRLAAHGGVLSVLVMVFLLLRVYSGVRNAARIPAKSEYAKVVTGYLAALIVSVEFYVGMGEMFWALLGVAASLSCIPPFRLSPAYAADRSVLNVRQKLNTRILVSRK